LSGSLTASLIEVQTKLEAKLDSIDLKNSAISDQLNKFERMVADLKRDNILIHERIDKMETDTSSRLEKVEQKLQQENALEKYRSLQAKVQDLEAYSRKCNLEITGIYEYPNEDLKEILPVIAQFCGVELSQGEILAVHRVDSFRIEAPRPIIVKLLKAETKRAIRNGSWKKRNINAQQIFPNMPQCPVYISDHLTPTMKKLRGMAKAQLSEWYLIKTQEGKVYAQPKADGGAERGANVPEGNLRWRPF